MTPWQRRALIRQANRLLKQAGFGQDRDPRQVAFERRIILTPAGGALRHGKCHRV